jgi:iron(III) transport system substrate-binding protein
MSQVFQICRRAFQAVGAWIQEQPLLASVGAVLVLLVGGPFLMRPASSAAPSRFDRRLVVLTPHHEAIRQEFGRGFAKHWKAQTGETLYVDWRAAGTSELVMILKSDYAAAFEQYWTSTLGKDWSHEVASEFLNPKATQHPARIAFLESRVGIGADVFFGGGPQDFMSQADLGLLVSQDPETGAGLAKLKAEHPSWFSDTAIPETISGETFSDAQMRWCGTALSSFGIVFNRDVMRRLGMLKDPEQWVDLADPRLRGQIALADPTKSGSVNKAFEMLVQQQMQQSLAASPQDSAVALSAGWTRAMQLIQRISANARYFTDSAPKIPLEVSQGDAAAGMCIDFHGRNAEERVRQANGTSRIGFVAPRGGSSIAVDPIALLRGASEPQLAQAFMEYVLSDAGQKLWCYSRGAPGGPAGEAIRRLPVRRDFYVKEHLQHMPDAAEMPYDRAQDFIYHPEWTGALFSVLRFIIRVSCVDTHHEQKQAWEALVKAGFPPRATEVFQQMDAVTYAYCGNNLKGILAARDKVKETQEARRLSQLFRHQYRLARELAEQGH